MYWGIFTVYTALLAISLISECFKAFFKVSVSIINRIPERGQPYLTTNIKLLRCEAFVQDPTGDFVIIYWTMTHFHSYGPKLNTSRDFCKYFNSVGSKAFSKSRKTARPGIS